MTHANVTKPKARSGIFVTDGIGNEVLKGAGVSCFAFGAGLLGVWVISAFVAGVVEAGGPISFVSSWFNAVTGGGM